jgi:hypothetical protein
MEAYFYKFPLMKLTYLYENRLILFYSYFIKKYLYSLSEHSSDGRHIVYNMLQPVFEP